MVVGKVPVKPPVAGGTLVADVAASYDDGMIDLFRQREMHGMAWHGMEWHGMAWHGMAWHGMAWHGMGWDGMR